MGREMNYLKLSDGIPLKYDLGFVLYSSRGTCTYHALSHSVYNTTTERNVTNLIILFL